ncbi:MAG TPA: PilZ domain-containing protein, partial [Geobacteraceae bacterium]
LLTTDWSVGAKAKCLQAGCDDFLLKPLKRHQFLDKGHRFIPGIERRDVRVWCHLNLSLQRNGLQLSATGEDISSGGIYVASDEKVRDDEEVNLTFSLPTATSREIVAKGRVAWRNSGSIRKKPLLPTGFGVEFMGIDDEATETIRQYVTTAISK